MIKKVLQVVFVFLILGFLLSCDKKSDTDDPSSPDLPENPQTPAYRNYEISTDKAAYSPGEIVLFELNATNIPANAKIRYRHLDKVVKEESLSSNTWQWTAPGDDFKGYMVEVFANPEGDEIILATIAVDVSSDWMKFPRYGFLSKFPELSQEEINDVLERLNRYHINGLQFYDWHNKHHQPLPLNNGMPQDSWKDIINRDIYFSTVEQYIEGAHQRNMKAMFYNLIYGAWDDAEEDGVSEEWYVYKDQSNSEKDFHSLPEPPFLSNIYLLDPSNENWQQYIADENQKVYNHLDFDGFHMDQLGNRGSRYRFDGSTLNLSETYKPFIESMQTAHPDKDLALNAVNQYGQEGIGTSSTGFLYTEVWSPNDRYSDLANIIRLNNSYSNGEKNTVLAAYMNYDMSGNTGYFNTAGVLMTNAVIFAFGGSHLELGEHMLGNEYFPNDNLRMKQDLKNALPQYYDFLTAYQNVLRDGGAFNTVEVQSLDGSLPLENWPASQGNVSVVAKHVEQRQVVHLINFMDSKTPYWRDNQGVQVSPAMVQDAEIKINTDKSVKTVWVASPDIIGGASRTLDFVQKDGNVFFTLPELKYWTMIVLEYE